MEHSWSDLPIGGSVLKPFEDSIDTKTLKEVHQDKRSYSKNSSYSVSVSNWRVRKPVFNSEHCINCYFCWVYCPDSSIIVREQKMDSVDYAHCKGCGICSDVCPSNPKSLLMFDENSDNKEVLGGWPQKLKKEKRRD